MFPMKSPIDCKWKRNNLQFPFPSCVVFRTGVKRIIGGNLELIGKVGEGKLNVKYATTPIATEQTLTVLHTDYDEYAVIWSCSDFGPVNTRKWLTLDEP